MMYKAKGQPVESTRRPWTPTELEDEKREITGYYGGSAMEPGSASSRDSSRWTPNSPLVMPHVPIVKTSSAGSRGWPTNPSSPPHTVSKPDPSVMLSAPNPGHRDIYVDMEPLAVLPSQKRALASANAPSLASPVSPTTPFDASAKSEITDGPQTRTEARASGSAVSLLPLNIPLTTVSSSVDGPPQVRLADGEGLLCVSGTWTRPINILLVNPTSSQRTTRECLQSVAATVPLGTTVHGFTAPHPAPTINESQLDAVRSTAACLPAVLAIAKEYDGFLILSFESQTLVDALREELMQPVLSTVEAVFHASRMVGHRLGVLTTDERSAIAVDDIVEAKSGVRSHVVVTEALRMTRAELEAAPRSGLVERLLKGVKRLRQRGANCVCLGNIGIASACQYELEQAVGALGDRLRTVDGVRLGVQFLTGLVRERSHAINKGTHESVDG